MWRTRAILSLLVEHVAALRLTIPQEEEAEAGAQNSQEEFEASLEALQRAQKRAMLVAAMDWIAILTLFFLRPDDTSFFAFGANPRTVFSFGILAVAVHSGFRLGQAEKYRAVERACRELSERQGS